MNRETQDVLCGLVILVCLVAWLLAGANALMDQQAKSRVRICRGKGYDGYYEDKYDGWRGYCYSESDGQKMLVPFGDWRLDGFRSDD